MGVRVGAGVRVGRLVRVIVGEGVIVDVSVTIACVGVEEGVIGAGSSVQAASIKAIAPITPITESILPDIIFHRPGGTKDYLATNATTDRATISRVF